MDLPFSIPFYRWLLTEENSLGLSDLTSVAPEVQTTLKRLLNIVRERDEISNDQLLAEESKNRKVILLNKISQFDSSFFNIIYFVLFLD